VAKVKGVKGTLEIPKGISVAEMAMEILEEIALFAEENPGAVLYVPEEAGEVLIEEALVMAKGGHPLALRFFRALEGIAFRGLPGGSSWEILEA
jgi:hypothetical protein